MQTTPEIELGIATYLHDRSCAGQAPEKAIPSKHSAADKLRSIAQQCQAGALLRNELATQQRSTLTGKTAITTQDLAAIALIYRDPRFETFRLVFTDEAGTITSQLGVTCRMPASTATAVGADQDAFISNACANAARLGATRAFMLHNHPSGDPTPSKSDIETTRRLAPLLEQHVRFQGHVVIDTTAFCQITASGQASLHKLPPAALPAESPMPSWNKVRVSTPQALMTYAKQLQISKDHITIVATVGASHEVTNVVDLPCSATEGSQSKVRAQLLRTMLSSTADRLHAISPNRQAIERLMHTISSGILVNDDGSHTAIVEQDNKASRRARTSPDTTPELLQPNTILVDGIERPTTNAYGQAIHPSDAGLLNFWRWFGNSKTVDSHGRPIPMYHGTDSDFDVFDATKRGQKDHGFYGSGFYHSADPETASAYATYDEPDATPGANVMANYVRLLNPYIWEDQPLGGRKFNTAISEQRTQELISQGYDGVIVPSYGIDHVHNGMHEVVAYRADQIKSATGNSGDFSPQSQSILQEGPAPQPHQATITWADERFGNAAASKNFTQWFADSKAVDQYSTPLTVYHGTTANFDVFNTEERGAFFTTSPASANDYTFGEPGGRIIAAHLSIQNPFIGHIGRKGPEIGAIIAKAKRLGHDSAILTYDDRPGEKAYVAFNPTQIRSSISDRFLTPVQAWAQERFGKTIAPNGKPAWENFVEWFGESKMLDTSGTPLIAYHGTKADFSAFSDKHIGDGADTMNNMGDFGEGFYFTRNAADASGYAGKDEGANVMPVFLSIKNPIDARQLMDIDGVDGMMQDPYPGESLRNLLEPMGYDGIVINEGEELVAFRPTQIKSALGNSGDFDQSQASIIEERSATTAQRAFDRAAIEESRTPAYKGREKLISMRIDDFLALAKDEVSTRKLEGTRELVKAGTPFSTLPYLNIDRTSRVDGHEGRHRARALREAGHTTIPVILRSANIRWSEQSDPARFDYLPEWPEFIQAQKGAANEDLRLPFPVRREDAATPYQGSTDAPRGPIENWAADGARHYEGDPNALEVGDGGGAVHDTYRPFTQQQIKSSIGNKGDFDPEKPSIVEDIRADDDQWIEVDGTLRPREDSEGLPIADTDDVLRSFWRAFAGSVTVDTSGRPLALYHGTKASFEKFEIKKAKPGLYGKGFYFAENKKRAEAYANGGRIVRAYVDIKQPNPRQAKPVDGMVIGSTPGDRNFLAYSAYQITITTREAVDITQTASFKEWFGESKVRDANGKPKVMFHGTASEDDFTEFAPMHSSLGTHIGTRSQANDLAIPPADDKRHGARILPVYIQLNNPLRLIDPGTGNWATDAIGQQLAEIGIIGWGLVEDSENIETQEYGEQMIDAVKRAGYDGIVYLNRREGNIDAEKAALFNDLSDDAFRKSFPGAEDSYIVFDPSQIKSAVGNNGRFSRHSASILEDGRNEQACLIEVDGKLRPTTNASGHPIHSSAQGIHNFWKWFGDSQSVDEQGRPLVAFHGTKAQFTEFNKTRSGEFGSAIYATDSAREASEYGDGKGWGGPSGTHVMPIYVKLTKPYMQGVDQFWKDFGRNDGDKAAIARAQLAGFDGVIAKRADRYYDSQSMEYIDRGDTLTHFVAFEVNQVKSVTGNNGKFHRDSNHIVEDSRGHGLIEVDGALRPMTNSADQPLHSTLNGIRSFWKWFGDSSNVDEQGRPIVFFHGSKTPEELHQFAPGGTNGSRLTGDAYGVASYFSTSAHEASAYAGDEGAVLPVYIRGRILNVDAPLAHADQEALSKFANEVMLPQDKARFSQGRCTLTIDNKEDAHDFFSNQMENWKCFAQGFDRAKPEVTHASGESFTVEYTDFTSETRITNGQEAFTLFNAIGWDNLPSSGFDGMVMHRDGGQQWAVIHRPDGNIKSALGNAGTFYGHRNNLLEDNARSDDADQINPAIRMRS